ncbi:MULTISPECIES: hypothetical protein [Acinetobacter]|uniref:hypothetical protein n=1 Tax=Acinetobacter TaxID=469 RepID=UPI0006667368|nr:MULTISPECIES: hypothetical protein [Acinetobacter]
MTDLNKLRSEFEAMPLIKEKLNAVYFDETLNSYFAAMINSSPTVKYIQGAWMAWQEKAKAQAVPNEIINKIQSWVAVKSFAVEDAHPDLPIIDANELAEFIDQLVASESGAEG